MTPGRTSLAVRPDNRRPAIGQFTSADEDAVREARFARMLDLVWRAHPYYRAMFRDLGLRRDDVRSLADLTLLPITSRAQFSAQPEAFRLRSRALRNLTLAERTLWGVVYTAGTALGMPTPFYDTNYDHAARIDQLHETALLMGLREEDVVLNCFPLAAVSHQGFLSALYAPLTVGARLVAGFSGSPATPFPIYQGTDEVIRRAERQRATVLWGITSYIRRLLRRAEEFGTDLSDVRMVFVAGEPCPAGMREDLRARLKRLGAGRVIVQNGYGFTELQGPTIECAEGGPFHVPAAGRYALEVVEPDTGLPVADGVLGRLLVTHLDRRGTVLLRYAVEDLTAIERGRCPTCGRMGLRIVSPPRRLDDLVKIRGTLVTPTVVIAALSDVRGVDDFQVAVRRAAPDPLAEEILEIRVLARGEADLQAAIVAAVRNACEVRPEVRIMSEPEFTRLLGPYKFRRFVDERDTGLD